jgi:tetratricopeptide (TPR) repeat protein
MNGKRLCLNMIVRNEMANLERCLAAVVPHIACWVIGDTGSSDGTQDFIMRFFAARGLSGELHSFPFDNFEQARNAALDFAYASPLGYDYLVFADADMELVVEDPDFRERLEAPGYRLIQRTEGGLTYWNARLAARGAGARYHGVTHEYLDVPGETKQLHGVWYKDHASGSNRVDKFERDIGLLTEALKREPEERRYWFYLAQSYKDAGRTAEAAETYAKRAAMGGWDEEAWYARLMEARCLRDLGDEGGFLRQALAAFNQRPQRCEPIYDLARFYRERGMNEASVLFSEPGLAVPRPDEDVLFLEDFIYMAGLREEFSIAANYARDPARKDRGFAACNWLALNRDIPAASRELARSNLLHYMESADAMMPSFAARPLTFTPPDGYRASNPSVARRGDEIVLVQRAVNYELTDGRYQTPNDVPIHTRNFLLRLSGDLETQSSSEILPPADLPEPAYRLVRGFEDLRLFAWRDALWCCGCVRELTPEGWCEHVLARVDDRGPGPCHLTDWRVLHPPGPRLHEKNWMPRVAEDALQFIYRCDPTHIVDDAAQTVVETSPAIAAERFSGGSPAIAFAGGWLALVHEALARPSLPTRVYQHRFVWFDVADVLRRVSRPFFFHEKGVEFAAGLAWHPDGKRLLISCGVGDRESWIATVEAAEVRAVLEDVERLPSGLPVAEDRAGDGRVDEWRGAAPEVTRLSAAGADGGPEPAQPNAEPVAPAPTEEEALPAASVAGAALTTEETFLELAPFLAAVDSPAERRRLSRAFDARIAPFLDCADTAALPQIHCFYEVLSDKAEHRSLIAATTSMRAAGHPVQVWSYAPQKLEFLLPYGIELRAADDVVPRGLFERIVAGSEIRYFSDIFRYAVLYEHGGLWVDTDVVLLRPFPYRGDHFLNLQWRGGHQGHFICGNVMYAKPYSHHLRNLYEMSIDRFFGSHGTAFGDIGPKLLSDYVASESGAELQDRLFGPVFFNPIDWTEIDRFNQPIGELAEYLNDDRVFGVHLWNAKTNAVARDEAMSLISLLSDPLVSFPSAMSIADRLSTDKNRHTGNHHFYARVYDRLLSSRRFSLRRLMEIGLSRWNQTDTPSATLWQTYFPFCRVIGVDREDFSELNNERFSSFVCDQSKPDEVRSVAERIEPGSLDVIIDDGSHASYDQQMTFREFFPLLAAGGWYFIEDLDWQPPGEDSGRITLTKNLLREIQQHGSAQSVDPLGISEFSGQIADILFFDSHYELQRATLMGGLAAIRKRGGTGLVG